MDNSFNFSYLIFSHGLSIQESSSNFVLPPTYRLVTLHVPGETISTNLINIIFDQIEAKTDMINNLFNINCPIARGTVKKMIEDNMIIDYLKKKFNQDPKNIKKYLIKYNIKYDLNETIETIDQFNKIIQEQNLEDIKKIIKFELRIYRSGDMCPKLLLNFKIDQMLSSVPAGIYNVLGLKDFNNDKTSKEIDFKKKQMNPLIDLEQKKYVFESFFGKIKNNVPGGLLILLACDTLQRPQSNLTKQNVIYKKYLIEYDK